MIIQTTTTTTTYNNNDDNDNDNNEEEGDSVPMSAPMEDTILSLLLL